jgi:hypothetical protein
MSRRRLQEFYLTSLNFHFTANLFFQDTVERIYAGNLYADVPRGVFLVRGENVLLLGEVVCAFEKLKL